MSRRTSTTFRVRYGETDQMGVVYHPNYLVWCEIGRTELIRELGVSYAELERRGVLLAVADAGVRYSVAAHYDDVVRVDTTLAEVRSRSVRFEYEVHRVEPNPARLATAHTTLISIDREGQLRALPPEVKSLFR